MDWKFEKNMYPILDTRVEIKISMAVRIERIKNYPYFNLYMDSFFVCINII